MQSYRIPPKEVAELLIKAGIKVHFGGHMHINDTRVHTSEAGKRLVNVQVPSLGAYIPAYKLLSFKSDSQWQVQTIVLDSVEHFDHLFDLYAFEHQFLNENHADYNMG